MGYLNNTTVTVDAILTERGRELLSQGAQHFSITNWALADDEVDYGLFNFAHQLGTNYYGEVIDNMPVFEALPDETTQMLFKLVTLPKATVKIPVIDCGPSELIFTSNQQLKSIVPQTTNITNGNAQWGYSCTIADSSVCTLTVRKALPTGQVIATSPTFIGDAGTQSKTVTGLEFDLRANQSLVQDLFTTVIVTANQTGGRTSVSIRVNQPLASVSYTGVVS
jgi:hypothetical protein